LILPDRSMARLASIIVGRGRVQTRHAVACSIDGSVHGYELFFCNPRLHGRLQEQVHGSLCSGLLMEGRFTTCTAESKSHISHRIRRKR
jgi:hypothetical protein